MNRDEVCFMSFPNKTVIDAIIAEMESRGWAFPRQILNREAEVVGCAWGADQGAFGVGLHDDNVMVVGRAGEILYRSAKLDDVVKFLAEQFAAPLPGDWQPRWRVG